MTEDAARAMPKPALLLHTCCGPCATACVERLRDTHAVTLFFSNSNIAPEAEYSKRLEQARKLARALSLPLVEDAYDHDAWLARVRGFEAEPEGGRRCPVCFRFSLERTARHAQAGGFAAFTTTLTVSPHKDSPTIFAIGESWDAFLPVNFKKADGFRRGIALARQYDLYRQDYCGCEFSRRPRPVIPDGMRPPSRSGATPARLPAGT
jgi:predicted adenine nucleotide alpha hydrolase (AANH) superfamily ATPase